MQAESIVEGVGEAEIYKGNVRNYMRPTKSMERHFSNADQDVVRQAFLPTSYVQLRRLPAKLRPGSVSSPRMQNTSGIKETVWGKDSKASPKKTVHDYYNDSYQESHASASSHGRSQQHGANRPASQGVPPGWGGPQPSSSAEFSRAKMESREVRGTIVSHQFSIAPKTFSSFVYLPSDFDALRKKRSKDKRDHMSLMSGPTSFKCGIPPIPDKQGSFTHFQYYVDPYESRDEFHKSKREPSQLERQRKSFTPSGKYSSKNKSTMRKASSHILMERLVATLRADWPRHFTRCFSDRQGLIVCLFSEGADSTEGGDAFGSELYRYMNQMIRTHPVVNEFILHKMSSRWGRQNNGFIEYSMVPPWIKMNVCEPYFQMNLEEAARMSVQKGGNHQHQRQIEMRDGSPN
mmetsp:Transcript_36656/g.93632  ORF Transcript_36656/g.93632 Transcript_36656/m.93632 type:complete len:405 (-) Transcript_36656:443-1657(-)